MLFNDVLVQRGADGGREAANQLRDMISAEIQSSHHLPQDIKVVVRIYASVNKLGMACTYAGILPSPDVMEQFARGFTGAKQLFDFVDVGIGKDRADDKLAGLFRRCLCLCSSTDRLRNTQIISSQLPLPSDIFRLLPRQRLCATTRRRGRQRDLQQSDAPRRRSI